MNSGSSFESTSSASGSSGSASSAGSSGARSSRSGSGSFNLRNLSKVILPPLGGPSSGHGQSHGGSDDKWVISPLHSRYRCWETFMVVLVAYSAWVYPFEVAFMNASPKGGLEVADMVVDLFFAVDIVLTFFVAYIDPRTQLLVRDRKKIALRYVRALLPLICSSAHTPRLALASHCNGQKVYEPPTVSRLEDHLLGRIIPASDLDA
ncbi:unnamed protein product [Urochloa humidicola]